MNSGTWRFKTICSAHLKTTRLLFEFSNPRSSDQLAAKDCDKSINVNTLDSKQLREACEELKNREVDVQDIYGKYFTDIVGLEQIVNLPVYKAQELGLQKDPKYPNKIVKPSFMKEPAVERLNRKPTAIHCD